MRTTSVAPTVLLCWPTDGWIRGTMAWLSRAEVRRRPPRLRTTSDTAVWARGWTLGGAGSLQSIAVCCNPIAAHCTLLQLTAAHCGGWTGRRTARTRRRSTTPRLSAPHRPPGLARQRAWPISRAGPTSPALLRWRPAPHAAPAGFRLAAPSEVVLDPWAGRCCSAGRRTA